MAMDETFVLLPSFRSFFLSFLSFFLPMDAMVRCAKNDSGEKERKKTEKGKRWPRGLLCSLSPSSLRSFWSRQIFLSLH